MRQVMMRWAGGAMLTVVLVAGCGGSDSSSSSASSSWSSSASSASAAPSSASPSASVTMEAEPELPVATLPRGSVPPELVGEWDGDGTNVRFDKIRFSADGGVALLFINGGVFEGTAVTEKKSLTLYVPGGPIHYQRWSIEKFEAGYGYAFENLVLDGVSYVRQTSGA